MRCGIPVLRRPGIAHSGPDAPRAPGPYGSDALTALTIRRRPLTHPFTSPAEESYDPERALSMPHRLLQEFYGVLLLVPVSSSSGQSRLQCIDVAGQPVASKHADHTSDYPLAGSERA